MSEQLFQTAELRRINPQTNTRRFYRLSLWPDLFGGVSVVREWGRLGTRGQWKTDPYPSPDQAAQALARLHRQKLRRGYVAP